MKKHLLLAAIAATTVFASCSDDNGGNSDDKNITDKNVVNDDASAVSLVNGVYSHWQPLSS